MVPLAADIAPVLSSSDIPPDWATLQRDILCPLCDYNLRGLVDPRCPECGYQFDWRELQQEKAREHPYLFEHHRRNNLRSFLRTFRISALRPRRFWRELQPLHRPNPRRLVIYWIVAAAVCMVLAWPMFLAGVASDYAEWAGERRQWFVYAQSSPEVVKRYGTAQAFVNVMVTPSFTQWRAGFPFAIWMRDVGGPVIVIMLCWPWLTFAALLLYRASLRQAMIHRSHVMRCAVYSADGIFIVGPLLMLAGLLKNRNLPVLAHMDWLYEPFGYHADPSVVIPLLLTAAVLTYRLAIAYRQYLRFRHSLVAVIASQVIVGLIIFKAYFFWRVGY